MILCYVAFVNHRMHSREISALLQPVEVTTFGQLFSLHESLFQRYGITRSPTFQRQEPQLPFMLCKRGEGILYKR